MAECYNRIYLKKQDITVNCGKCLNCKQNKKREYSIRAVQDFAEKKNIYFATLTYNNENAIATKDGLTISKTHAKNYIKRVRQQMRRDGINEKLSYFMSGEYGAQTQRPHYHITVGTDYRLGGILKEKWKYGDVKIEKGTNASVFYTVGYSDKKMGVDDWKYNNTSLVSPFHKFKQGIGKNWIDKNKDKITKDNYYLNTNYGKMALPQYYKDRLYKVHETITDKDRQEIKKEVMKKLDKEKRYLINKYAKNDKPIIYNNGEVTSKNLDEIVEGIRGQIKEKAIAKLRLRKEKRTLI